MKKFVFYVLLILISLNLYCAVIDYAMIPPHTLPEFSGEISDPDVRIVFQDADGIYVIVIYEDMMYVFYL